MTRYRVLGPLTVQRDGVPLNLGAPKQRALLAALLLTPGRPLSVERLVDEVWPEEPPPTAGAALQVYASGLRKVLGGAVRSSPPGYLLEAAPADVDAHVFETMLRQARAWRAEHPARTAAHLADALALWSGPAFDGVAAGSGVAAAAARLEQLRRSARLDWATVALDLGRHREAVAELAAWATEHATDEGLIRQYMLALHRCGRSAEAMEVYGQLRGALRSGLGVEPEEETVALAKAIRRRDPTVEAVTPNLPAPVSRFIGRRAELDRAGELLGRSRLLTITGPGGAGKTRFALELAREVAPAHPAGVHLVELAGSDAGVVWTEESSDEGASDEGRRRLKGVGPRASEASASITGVGPRAREASAIITRVVGAIGARDTAGGTSDGALHRFFGAERHLLILDNCERVRQASAELVESLLSACRGLRVAVTSREPLGVPGEAVLSLGGLALPAPTAPAPDAARSDAVRLFLDRADAARGGIRLHRDEEATVVEICRRLDGLPLAIELAAARLRALSLPEVAGRLDRRLSLLVGGAGPDRHRTMRAAIDWSHELLDPAERRLLRRLGVFVGGFTVAAAEAVAVEHVADDLGDVLDVLSRLVDRSMVAHSPGTGRYRLIETIREYAVERLGHDDEAQQTRRRHATWYAAQVAAPPPVDGPAHAAWLAATTAEHDNLRAALAWALSESHQREGADAKLGLQLATSLWWYWWVTGQMVEGRQWLGRALAADADRPVTPVRGRALRAAAALARNNGDLTAARALGEECLRIHEQLADAPGTIAALNNLSITAQGQRDYEASLAYGYAGLALAERAQDKRAVAAALNNTAGTLRCLDRLDEAQELFRRALVHFGEIADRRGEAAALGNLSVVARRRGRLLEARELALRTLRAYHELDLAEGVLDAVEALAHLDVLTDRPERARRALELAAAERIRLGAPIFTPDEIADRDRAEELARAHTTTAPVPGTLPDVIAEYLSLATPS